MPSLTVHGLEIPPDVHTIDGFRAWYAGLGEDSGIRATFASGEVIVEMSPQSYWTHEPLAEAINTVLSSLAGETQRGRYYRAPSWITAEDLVSTEPDGFLVTWERLRNEEVCVNPERPVELVGAPDMTLEVVSKTSVKKDLELLRTDYARIGVREYWIADGRADPCSLRILRLEDGRYLAQTPDADGWLASPVWQRSFRLRRTTNPAGQPDFTLDVR